MSFYPFVSKGIAPPLTERIYIYMRRSTCLLDFRVYSNTRNNLYATDDLLWAEAPHFTESLEFLRPSAVDVPSAVISPESPEALGNYRRASLSPPPPPYPLLSLLNTGIAS